MLISKFNFKIVFSIVFILSFFSINTLTEAATVGSSPIVTATSSCSTGLSCGLVGYWTLDGKDTTWTSGTAGTTVDKSGNGNTGTLTGMSQITAPTPGKIGQGLKFDGVDDAVRVNDSNTLTFGNGTTDQPFSISAWVYYVDTRDGGFFSIVSKYTTNIFDGEYTFSINENSAFGTAGADQLSVQLLDDNAVVRIKAESTTSVPRNQWVQLAMTYSGSGVSTGLRLWMNGVEMSVDRATDGAYVAMDNETSFLTIGAALTAVSFDDYALGKIDDVRIYNRAISATEIRQLYNQGALTKQASSPIVTATSSCSTGLSCGLVGYWTFDGKDMPNGVALDKSGNRNHGNLVNISTSTFYTSGKIGQGLKFDGTNDYVVSDLNKTTIGSIPSISLWVKSNTSQTTKGVFQIADGLTNSLPWILIQRDSTSLKFFLHGAYRITLTFNDNEWHHIVILYDGTTWRSYLDGVAGGTFVGASGSFLGAKTWIGNGYNGYFNGSMDDVRIYNRALSATEVRQLYNLGANSHLNVSQNNINSGLVGYWTMDGKDTPWTTSTAATTKDKSGNGNTGTLTNMTQSTATAPGKIGQGLKFDGVDDFVNLSNLTDLDFSQENAFTLAAWVYPDGSNAAKGIFSRGGTFTTAGSEIYNLSILNTDATKWRFAVSDGTNLIIGHSLAGTVSANTWQHMAVAWNGTTLTLYKNGASIQSASGTFTGLWNGDDVNDRKTSIGQDARGNSLFFKGKIDDVRTYSRALSATEISQLYNLGR